MLTDVLGAIARWSFRHRRLVLVLASLVMALGVPVGIGMGDQWSTGGYTAEGTPAERAEVMAQKFGAGTPDLVLYARPGRSVDAPGVAERGRRLTALAADSPGVASAVSYWNTGLEPLRSADGRGALVRLDLKGDQSRAAGTARTLVPALRAAAPELGLSATGSAWINVSATDQAERDLVRSELLTLPLTFAVLVLAFGSLGATLAPLLIGGVAAAGSLAVLALCTRLYPVSVFSANLSFALGFGLAVDYGLFTLFRYREERARGLGQEEAIVRAMSTAGRAVTFCALTMACCTASLFVCSLGMVRSLATASIIVVAFCLITTVVLLSALLGALGDRLESWDPFRRLPWRRSPEEMSVSPMWRRIAVAVTARPRLCTGLGAALLLALALPAAGLHPKLVDDS
ncbi:MMPL family transporter, partial [Streptomyces sp. NPDC059003]|uniref:MMPL family transporter n=1 Tax=Streptomyces sp. NPDC059003 TaxID=3346691 RepID=UPI0036C2C71B